MVRFCSCDALIIWKGDNSFEMNYTERKKGINFARYARPTGHFLISGSRDDELSSSPSVF